MYESLLQYIVNADDFYRLWMVGEFQSPTPMTDQHIAKGRLVTQPREEWFPPLVEQMGDVRMVPTIIRCAGAAHAIDSELRFHAGNNKPTIQCNKLELIWGNDTWPYPTMSAEDRVAFRPNSRTDSPVDGPARPVGPCHVTLNGLRMWHHQDTVHRRRGDAVICDLATFQWNTKSANGFSRENGPYQVVIKNFRAAYNNGDASDVGYEKITTSWGTENGVRIGESIVHEVVKKFKIKMDCLHTDNVIEDAEDEFIFWDEIGRARDAA